MDNSSTQDGVHVRGECPELGIPEVVGAEGLDESVQGLRHMPGMEEPELYPAGGYKANRPRTILIDGFNLGRSGYTMSQLIPLLQAMPTDTRVMVAGVEAIQNWELAAQIQHEMDNLPTTSALPPEVRVAQRRALVEHTVKLTTWCPPPVIWGFSSQIGKWVNSVPVGSRRWRRKSEWELPPHKRKRTKAGEPSPLIAALTKKL